LYHVGAIVVKIPEFAVMFLMSPPKWVLLEDLILLEVLPHTPAFVIGKSKTILLKERVNPGNTSVPRIF
jgi:hypothetical protein